MKFDQVGFIRRLYTQGFFPREVIEGQKVIVIGDIELQSSAEIIQYLQVELRRVGVAEYTGVSLFNPFTMNAYVSVAEMLENIGREKFDFVILLEGLEKERDFVQAVSDIQSLCKPDGALFIMARSPLETGTGLALKYYEDEWRYEPQDLATLFSACEVERAALSEPAYVMGMLFRKKAESQPVEIEDYALYNCRAGRRISRSEAQAQGFFRQYRKLDEIGIRFHTDKCSFSHNYLNKYELFLVPHRQECFNLLELGVLIGSSEYMWQEYFPNAQIYGVDINSECHQYATDRVHIIQADLSQVEAVEQLKKIKPYIIVDDASHLWSHQILALFVLFDALPNGGLYILEDMETSVNQKKFPGYNDAEISAYEVCSRIAQVVESKEEDMNGPYAKQITEIGMKVELISFMKGSCIMIKR